MKLIPFALGKYTIYIASSYSIVFATIFISIFMTLYQHQRLKRKIDLRLAEPVLKPVICRPKITELSPKQTSFEV